MPTPNDAHLEDEIASATVALKATARLHRDAVEHPDVRAARDRVTQAGTVYRDGRRRQRRGEIAAERQREAIVLAALAQSESTITALTRQLATEQQRRQQLQKDHDAGTLRIADLEEKPRRRAILDCAGEVLDPEVPPAPLALMHPDAWQALYRDVQQRKSASVIVVFDEINGWCLEVEHHPAGTSAR